MDMKTIFTEDFSSFKLGSFPYDHEHSAMGEYHFYPEKGYKGAWFDPISYFNFRGPSWIVTDPDMDGHHAMEQQRLCEPGPKQYVPCLRTGGVDWKDYTVKAVVKPLIDSQISGIAFRYQTSMMHYGFYLVEGGVALYRVNKLERTLLNSAKVDWSTDDWHLLEVAVEGEHILCKLDGKSVIEATDGMWKNGCIALTACVPTLYREVSVVMEEAVAKALEDGRKEEKALVAKLQGQHAKAKLWKKFDLKDFGAGRQIRFGHLTGTDELFFVMCQHQRRVFKDRYPFISCMTAVSFETGKILWQVGEPRDDDEVVQLTTDLPFQVYDIDGDGVDEVICGLNFKVMILDGKTGKVRKEIPAPLNDQDPRTVTSLEFGKYAMTRLNVDAIRIVNVSGKSRPSDILIKDRYSRLWVYDKDFNLLWKFSHYNTGHFPYGYDFDGDGKDEIYSCYNMIDHDGKLKWCLPMTVDHTDEIIIGKFDPDEEERIAIVSGWEGFMILDKETGKILKKDINGHGQRISVGNYYPQMHGLQIATTTYWGNNGIVYMHDCHGNEIWHKEMLANGNVIAPVNWDGNGVDLMLLNADVENGGLVDGDGRQVVRLPDDGHPTLCCEVENITGDRRPEILCWDNHQLWVYTQDTPLPDDPRGEYAPETYEKYNASNYRGEFSFPRWIKK